MIKQETIDRILKFRNDRDWGQFHTIKDLCLGLNIEVSELQEIFLTTENYSLVTVPARVWNGFKSVENKFSIIANCSDIPHEAEEMSRKPFDDPYFNYNWNIKLG